MFIYLLSNINNMQTFNLFSDFIKGLILSLLYISVTQEQDFNIQSLLRYTMYYFVLDILFLNIDINRDLLITIFVSKCISVIIEDRMKQNNMSNILDADDNYNSPSSNPSLINSVIDASISPNPS
jgi:hypothetical protein